MGRVTNGEKKERGEEKREEERRGKRGGKIEEERERKFSEPHIL